MFKGSLIAFAVVPFLAACQMPLVPVRSYTFDATFLADGRQYALSAPYQCHHEDIAWMSMVGPGWHVRKGTAEVRILGRLADGTAFEVLPRPDQSDRFCAAEGGPVASQLFLAMPDGSAVSVDPTTNGGAPHQARLLQATLSPAGTGLAPFVEPKQWPAPTRPNQRFYTVEATYYASTQWKQHGTVAAMVRDKVIPWLDDAKVWAFTTWTDADVAFARARSGVAGLNGRADSGRRFPLSASASGGEWRFSGPNNDPGVWQPYPGQAVPAPAMSAGGAARPSSGSMTRWVQYGPYRIEVPLGQYYRVFYEQKTDRLIEFRAVHIVLW